MMSEHTLIGPARSILIMPPREAFETTGLSKGDAIYALDLFQARVEVYYEDVPGATLWVAYDMRQLRARLQKN
jgi:hypothetical protein